jgi:hypothetical protein
MNIPIPPRNSSLSIFIACSPLRLTASCFESQAKVKSLNRTERERRMKVPG